MPADRAGNPCKKLFGLLNHTVVEKGRTDVLFLFLLLRLKIFYIIFLFYHSHQNIGDLLKFHLVLDLG